jgi:hypothetical protein
LAKNEGWNPNFPAFNCSALPTPPPCNDVRQLRPGNIKVVMAVGDSISAGFAMNAGHFWDLKGFVEFRGDVFSIGGNPKAKTIPNYLKNYNPNIVGASVGDSLPLDAIQWQNHIIQPFDPEITHLNGAQSMARIDHVPSQIDYITQSLQTTYKDKVDFKNDWKMMTVFIGANNICPSCTNRTDVTPEYFERMMDFVVNKIYTQIPRTYVNIVLLFNISQVREIVMQSDYCYLMWDTFCKGECGCMTDPKTTPANLQAMDDHSVWFNQGIRNVAKKWQAKNLKEFNVVAQPFIENLSIPPEIGLDFLSKLDCFHPSSMANTAWSIGLWNNMLTPAGQKQTNLDLNNLQYKCPDANTFLQ